MISVIFKEHIPPKHLLTEGTDEQRVMWRALMEYHERGGQIWYDLELMHDALELWEYIKPHTPTVLTATGRTIESASDQKRRWVADMLCPYTEVLFVEKARQKARHSGPNKVLIDDKQKAISPWIEAGGIGILHTSAKDTIRQLEELGI